MRTTPATSSKDGAFPVGGGVCGTVRATRAGEGGAEGGSLGTICGCATACGCVTTTADEFEAFACPAALWMPQKSFAGSRNSTSIYPFTVGRFRALTTRQTTSRPCGFETVTAWPGGKLPASRRTAPFSNTMTVLASSWVGFAGPEEASPCSPGKLRIVTATSKQTGLDRVFVL